MERNEEYAPSKSLGIRFRMKNGSVASCPPFFRYFLLSFLLLYKKLRNKSIKSAKIEENKKIEFTKKRG